MCKIFAYVAVLYFAIVLCHEISIPESGVKVRNRREISEECRPFPPPHRHHGHHGPEEGVKKMPPMCCELPEILSIESGIFEKCQELQRKSGPFRGHGAHQHGDRKHIKRSSEDSHGDNSKDNGPPPPPPSPGAIQEKKECMLNCVFNASGLLTEEGLLNEDLLNQKSQKIAANNTKWATTIDPVYKKCVAAAKEANSQSQKSCKQGAAEYIKCTSRELFFNCPSDLWVNSAECNEFKNKLEKCPNLWAPHPPLWIPREHPSGHRHDKNYHQRAHKVHY